QYNSGNREKVDKLFFDDLPIMILQRRLFLLDQTAETKHAKLFKLFFQSIFKRNGRVFVPLLLNRICQMIDQFNLHIVMLYQMFFGKSKQLFDMFCCQFHYITFKSWFSILICFFIPHALPIITKEI